MKLSKKVLAAFSMAAALAMAVSFTGCGEDDDETDPYGIVNGSNNNYWVGDKTEGYTNTESTTVRGFDSTTFNHAGGLVEVTFKDIATVKTNSTYDNSAGVMGLIWNLAGEAGSTKVTPIPETGLTFYIVGARCSRTGEVKGYISKYEGVTDLNATNFGAPTDASSQKPTSSTGNGTNGTTVGTTETIIKDFTGSTTVTPKDGNVTVWIYVSANKLSADNTKYDGTFTVKVLSKQPTINNNEIDETSITESDVLFEGTTPDSVENGVSKSDIQKKLGVYANVYPGANLRGTWKFNSTFLNAGVVEE